MSTTPNHSKGLISSLSNITKMYQLYLDNPEVEFPPKIDKIRKPYNTKCWQDCGTYTASGNVNCTTGLRNWLASSVKA